MQLWCIQLKLNTYLERDVKFSKTRSVWIIIKAFHTLPGAPFFVFTTKVFRLEVIENRYDEIVCL